MQLKIKTKKKIIKKNVWKKLSKIKQEDIIKEGREERERHRKQKK